MALQAMRRVVAALERGSRDPKRREAGLRPRLAVSRLYAKALYRRSVSLLRRLMRQHAYTITGPLLRCAQFINSYRWEGGGGAVALESIDLGAVPYKVLVSLEKHADRRNTARTRLAALALDVAWKIPVKFADVPWATIPSIYARMPQKASQAITLLEIFDAVERANASSFIHFEDDVIFHPRLATLLPRLRVPRDWKFIYLGGRNNGKRSASSPGFVRSDFISDLHAVIIRSDMIPAMRRALLDHSIDSYHVDFRIATLHGTHPAYLCRPNLAWQSPHSDDEGRASPYCNYYVNGTVRIGVGD
jgi:hypothetical protein